MRTGDAAPDHAGDVLAALDRHVAYAYQPIDNAHTGESFGFEALLRGHQEMGFRDVPLLFASIGTIGLARPWGSATASRCR